MLPPVETVYFLAQLQDGLLIQKFQTVHQKYYSVIMEPIFTGLSVYAVGQITLWLSIARTKVILTLPAICPAFMLAELLDMQAEQVKYAIAQTLEILRLMHLMQEALLVRSARMLKSRTAIPSVNWLHWAKETVTLEELPALSEAIPQSVTAILVARLICHNTLPRFLMGALAAL